MKRHRRPLAAVAMLLCFGIAGAQTPASSFVPEDSHLRLRLADGSIVQVLAKSDVEMRRLRRHRTTGRSETAIDARRAKFEAGIVRQQQDRVFEIPAPGVVATVRG